MRHLLYASPTPVPHQAAATEIKRPHTKHIRPVPAEGVPVEAAKRKCSSIRLPNTSSSGLSDGMLTGLRILSLHNERDRAVKIGLHIELHNQVMPRVMDVS